MSASFRNWLLLRCIKQQYSKHEVQLSPREDAQCFVSLNISLSHSRSFEVTPFGVSHTSSSCCFIVTITPPPVFTQISCEKKYVFS